jgi:putrescine transport system permease protein
VNRRAVALFGALAFGYAFLYLPIAMLVLHSFNASRISSAWGGFSLRWYAALLRDAEVIEAALLSLRIALCSATAATVLGAAAGLALARMGQFRGRTLFTGMVAAPLVMPEVITGLSLLLLFVSLQGLIGWPAGRGELTITLAHTTFSLSYVAVVVQSRLANMDESLEEAAMDLGARPFRVLIDITVPAIAPALLSGWLLAFTLSLDDLVISSFVSGPGANTLPMLIFSKVKLGVTPDINALATLIIAMVSLGVAMAGVVMLRRERRAVLPSPAGGTGVGGEGG